MENITGYGIYTLNWRTKRADILSKSVLWSAAGMNRADPWRAAKSKGGGWVSGWRGLFVCRIFLA